MRKKKVLFVSNEFSIGGSTVSLLSLIVGMKEYLGDKVEITVLSPMPFYSENDVKNLLEGVGIKCKTMIYRNNYKFLGQKKNFTKMAHDIMNDLIIAPLCIYIKKQGFDIVCSNSSAVDVGARAAKLAGVQHVYYVREFMEEDHGLEYRNKKRMKKLLENSEYAIFISKAIEKKYTTLYRLQQTTQFFDGFVLADYYIDNHRILETDVVRLLQIGRLNDGKGTISSIEVMNSLKKSGVHNFHLEFVGNGAQDYVDRMNRLIQEYELEENVTISPFTTNIKEKLENVDVLLMNSRSEGFGRVTVEGMLAGCLVLGRNNAGTTEIIRHMENGLLYEEQEAAVNLLCDIINDREKYKMIAKNGQAWAVEEFDCVKTAKNFCDFLSISE